MLASKNDKVLRSLITPHTSLTALRVIELFDMPVYLSITVC